MESNLLRSALFEIRQLRHENELLRERSAVTEVFAEALGLRKNNEYATTDIVWEIERHLENERSKLTHAE